MYEKISKNVFLITAFLLLLTQLSISFYIGGADFLKPIINISVILCIMGSIITLVSFMLHLKETKNSTQPIKSKIIMKNKKFVQRLSSEELEHMMFALKNADEDWESYFSDWLESFDEKELVRRFDNEIGVCEASDRACLTMEHWNEYILKHPVVLMEDKAFRLACIVSYLMAEVYQIIATREVEK
ncbi:MAG: hypothetical protein DWQ19_11380 [Crenarchaeota archaeon]|mgnify:CR=1 FL=1|nr:MAG: hypothetical protein DWQ19_11380 [Thermoproteota archaeon]